MTKRIKRTRIIPISSLSPKKPICPPPMYSGLNYTAYYADKYRRVLGYRLFSRLRACHLQIGELNFRGISE
jgi:hypothetical protein